MTARRSPRLPIRLRLTALYGGVFFLAGGLIVLAMYLLVTVELERQPELDVATELAPAPNDAGGPDEHVEEVLPQIIERADETRREETLDSLLRQSVLALFAVGVGAALIGHQLAGRALRPLTQITATARRVADRSLHERIALQGPRDEIKELADTFDAMLERLDDAFRGQRHFVANASHELRTPLTVQRTLVEVALGDPDASADLLRRLGHSLLEVNARSERLIDGLLTLARSEHELTVREPCDLQDLVESALRTCSSEYADRGITVHPALQTAPVTGDPDLLMHLVLNLVQNACRHNDVGGEVWISTATSGADARLVVANTGQLIEFRDAERIFEPFERIAAERTGTSHGLGLSIVRSVAQSHDGEVSATARPGGGLEVTVRMPAAPPLGHDSPLTAT